MSKDETKSKMRLRNSSNMTAAIILVIVLVVVITLLSERHYFRWDLTSTGEHTLSDKTLQVLKNIQEPVTIRAFVRVGFQEAEDARKLLSAYQYEAANIHYELIDPERNPSVTRRYNVKNINTFVLEGYGRSQTVKIADEEHITNALITLIESETLKVYWLTGHGERVFQGQDPGALSMLQEGLTNENYEFLEINLMQEDIPKGASLVVIAAPVKSLFPEEVTSLEKHLKRGGRIIVFLEPYNDGGLKGFLKTYGIRITDDIIVDKLSRVMGGDYLLPMVVKYGVHDITSEQKSRLTVTALAYTSPNSWSETDRKSLDAGRVQFDEQDRQGPVSLAAITELEPPLKKVGEEKSDKGTGATGITGKGRMVVFGDVDFASNKRFGLAANGDFVMNTVNYLVGRENLIIIKKKHKPVEPLMLNRTQGMVVFWIPVIVIPLVLLFIGIVVWNRRRSR
ncbi:MAG: GldG family protein [Deltaproteobacteria bacterium]|nr:GldG family protein [Deltaproteobacteria bacterium]